VGNIRPNDEIKLSYQFRVEGEQPLSVDSVTATCGCLEPLEFTDTCVPGNAYSIKAILRPGDVRSVKELNSSIRVVFSGRSIPPVHLHVKGKVHPFIEVAYDSLVFDSDSGQVKTIEVRRRALPEALFSSVEIVGPDGAYSIRQSEGNYDCISFEVALLDSAGTTLPNLYVRGLTSRNDAAKSVLAVVTCRRLPPKIVPPALIDMPPTTGARGKREYLFALSDPGLNCTGVYIPRNCRHAIDYKVLDDPHCFKLIVSESEISVSGVAIIEYTSMSGAHFGKLALPVTITPAWD
jgi:hypothetical protein